MINKSQKDSCFCLSSFKYFSKFLLYCKELKAFSDLEREEGLGITLKSLRGWSFCRLSIGHLATLHSTIFLWRIFVIAQMDLLVKIWSNLSPFLHCSTAIFEQETSLSDLRGFWNKNRLSWTTASKGACPTVSWSAKQWESLKNSTAKQS